MFAVEQFTHSSYLITFAKDEGRSLERPVLYSRANLDLGPANAESPQPKNITGL
jgi:hypothetical protein